MQTRTAPAGPTLRIDPRTPVRVLVTGATGWIGGALARQLVEAGASVVGTRRPGGRAPAPHGTSFPCHEVDLADRAACRALMDRVRPSCVFHLASLVSGSRDPALIGATFDANLASTVHLMEAAAAVGVTRFVTAGSLEEPDAGEIPCSPYAAAKAAAALYAGLYARSGALDVRHARIAMVYGPGQRDRTKLVPHVLDALREGRLPRIGSGTRLADWIHLDDVVDALVRVAGREPHDGGAAPIRPAIGTGRLHSVRQVVERLTAIHGGGVRASFGAVADRAHERASAADAAATAADIGWCARIGLADGLARTLAAERASATAAPPGRSAPALESITPPAHRLAPRGPVASVARPL